MRKACFAYSAISQRIAVTGRLTKVLGVNRDPAPDAALGARGQRV
jgi:hypothetical protein